ncbi:MAG: Lrp/AsnC family transcriptional regulator [Saprospirales bacterium]|nr:MAG: Lrp/AsnC family transcriptional regulator [Saprospirales bacterium]
MSKQPKRKNNVRVKIDKTDRRILKILQENSKLTNLELSRLIGLSPAPTLERVKKLERADVIASYHANLNPKSIGLNVETFILVDLAWQKPNALEKFSNQIKEIDEVIEAYIITGEADMMLKVVCSNMAAYEELMFKKLSQIKEIERLKTLIALSKIKDSKVLPYDYGDKKK